jgi:hypothetical protein
VEIIRVRTKIVDRLVLLVSKLVGWLLLVEVLIREGHRKDGGGEVQSVTELRVECIPIEKKMNVNAQTRKLPDFIECISC